MSVPTELMTFDKRKARADDLAKIYPDRVPLIVKEHASSSKKATKYLVPYGTTISGVIVVLRGRLKLQETQAIYLTINNKMISGSQTVGELYTRERSDDGFLYVTYCFENVFG